MRSAMATPKTPTRLLLTRIPDSWAWMRPDLVIRLLPFTAAFVIAYVLSGRGRWLGVGLGNLTAQVSFAAAGPALAPGRLPCAHRGHVRVLGPGALPAAKVAARLDLAAPHGVINKPRERQNREAPPCDVAGAGGSRHAGQGLVAGRAPGDLDLSLREIAYRAAHELVRDQPVQNVEDIP